MVSEISFLDFLSTVLEPLDREGRRRGGIFFTLLIFLFSFKEREEYHCVIRPNEEVWGLGPKPVQPVNNRLLSLLQHVSDYPNAELSWGMDDDGECLKTGPQFIILSKRKGRAPAPRWLGTLRKVHVLGGAPDIFDFSHTQTVGTRCNLGMKGPWTGWLGTAAPQRLPTAQPEH